MFKILIYPQLLSSVLRRLQTTVICVLCRYKALSSDSEIAEDHDFELKERHRL